MAFSIELFPVSYCARYDKASGAWEAQWLERDQIPYAELAAMSAEKRRAVYESRNQLGLPAVSYTSQYGLGCFEGMKAFPRRDGALSVFRPDRNAARFASSMRGLKVPVYPEALFVEAVREFLRRNAALGYVPAYRAEWERDHFAAAEAIYLRPFMNSEGAIGVGIPAAPCVVITATVVSSYFKGGNTKAVTTKRIRATPFGTGSIKCASNYVISALAKREAEDAGYMEVVYLDAEHRRYVQEGSSCNIFFRLRNGTLVTPVLGDTILPGITRASVIELAKAEGVKVEERPVSIEEAMTDGAECFVTGTAAGVTPIESVTHNGAEAVYNSRKPGELSERLQETLKGIQYGTKPDTHGWNAFV
ncbi:aminotransferase class IV [Treponema endosymbiont of Eucomonympha sp.]|uniref:aminotransferase class IV n=1 Tax=Treponema endosymbiont of Eucomonympha sp. TaxID=1580831 RepID=UPI0007815DB0|nr:aminotransferase class IV [Treponema endosymbiont of Eucomonympha sp.]